MKSKVEFKINHTSSSFFSSLENPVKEETHKNFIWKLNIFTFCTRYLLWMKTKSLENPYAGKKREAWNKPKKNGFQTRGRGSLLNLAAVRIT